MLLNNFQASGRTGERNETLYLLESVEYEHRILFKIVSEVTVKTRSSYIKTEAKYS